MILSGSLCRVLRTTSSITASCAVMVLSGIAMPAHAGDWSLQSKFSGTAEVDDNYLLLANPDGAVFISTAEVYGDFIYKSHASQLDLIADIIGQSFVGPGSDGLSDTILPKLEAKYHQDGKRTDFDLRASYAREDLQSIVEEDIVDVVGATSDFDPHHRRRRRRRHASHQLAEFGRLPRVGGANHLSR